MYDIRAEVWRGAEGRRLQLQRLREWVGEKEFYEGKWPAPLSEWTLFWFEEPPHE
jgi:hypothetical protein